MPSSDKTIRLPAERLRVAALLDARAFWQFCLCGLIAAVAYLALTPTPPSALTTGWDKLNHVLAFVALSWSACLGSGGSRRGLWRLAIGLLAFGGLIEIAQLYVPGRSGEWGDLLADTIGIGFGTALALALSAFAAASARR